MSNDSKQSFRDKFIVPVVVGVSISIITAIILGEGPFVWLMDAAAQPTSTPAAPTTDQEPVATHVATIENMPPTQVPPAPVAEERNLTALSRIHASSVLPEEEIAGLGLVRYIPENAIDRDPATSWVEGVGGPGIGEQLWLNFSQPVTLTRLGIRVGFDRDEDIFYKNHRVHWARLLFSDGTSQRVEFDDRPGVQFASIANVRTTSLAIVIEEVYQSAKYDDTPIAEVEVWGYESP